MNTISAVEGKQRASSKKSVENKVQILWDEYLRIVTSVFAGVVSVEEMIDAANDFFKFYQKKHKQRLAPESLDQGYIDCTSGAALCGIYWWLTRNSNPIFFLENDIPKEGVQKPYGYITPKMAHSVVALPRNAELSMQQIEQAFYDIADKDDDEVNKESDEVNFVEYTNKFRFVQPHRIQPSRIFPSIDSFLAYQVARFKTKTSKKPTHTHLLHGVSHGHEIIKGRVVDEPHLPERITAAIRMGLCAEGSYSETSTLSVGMLGMNTKREFNRPIRVGTTVVNNPSNQVQTLFHIRD